MRLPDEAVAETAEVASDGTVVYGSAHGGVDIATQALDNGAVRMQTIIGSQHDSHRFTYGVGGGFTPVEAADGKLWVHRFDDAGQLQIFSVGDAWARDADGVAVPTHYDSIVQVVEPSADAAYPIVADPTWQWYHAAYGAGFSKAETKTLASYGAVTGFCAALPGPFGIACAVAGAQWFLQAQFAANANECVFIATVPAPLAVRWYSNECR